MICSRGACDLVKVGAADACGRAPLFLNSKRRWDPQDATSKFEAVRAAGEDPRVSGRDIFLVPTLRGWLRGCMFLVVHHPHYLGGTNSLYLRNSTNSDTFDSTPGGDCAKRDIQGLKAGRNLVLVREPLRWRNAAAVPSMPKSAQPFRRKRTNRLRTWRTGLIRYRKLCLESVRETMKTQKSRRPSGHAQRRASQSIRAILHRPVPHA